MKRSKQKFGIELTDEELYLIEDALKWYEVGVGERQDKLINKLFSEVFEIPEGHILSLKQV